MVITDIGRAYAAMRLGSNISFPTHIALGSGSSAVLTTNVVLTAETDRNAFTSTSFATARKWNFIADFSSVEMSGTNLKEYGVFTTGLSAIGSCWQREGFATIAFDGTNELKLDITWEIF